jgi:hypothetical protein
MGEEERGPYTFLRNEPTVSHIKMGSDIFGRQLVAQQKREVFRWVRFGKRTHREGAFEAY